MSILYIVLCFSTRCENNCITEWIGGGSVYGINRGLLVGGHLSSYCIAFQFKSQE